MLRTNIALIVVLVSVLTTGHGQTQREVSEDSYGVYSALLSQQYAKWFTKNRAVAISSFTGLTLRGDCSRRPNADCVSQELFSNLVSVNNTRLQIARKLALPGPYSMAKGKIKIAANEEPGLVTLSAVAFSANGKEAMVSVRNSCGPLCGSGLVWKLTRTRQGWRTAGSLCGYIS